MRVLSFFFQDRRPLLLAAGMMFFLLLGFAELADDMLEGDFHAWDEAGLRMLRADDLAIPLGPPWMLQVARDITALGSHAVLTLVTLLAVGYCAIIRRYGTLCLILAASAGGTLVSSLLKWAFGRTRPDIVPHLVEVSSASFPSGHAMLSAAIYLSLAAIITQILPRRRQKLYLIAAALLLTGLAGLSRIYLGVHYPSDVLAGWMAGTNWALLCWLLAKLWRRDQQQEPLI